MSRNFRINKTQAGFSLVELVIGIVVLAVALVMMSTMLISQSKDALEPLYRLRASQLGQSILQNIVSRAYDEKSDHNGGYYRCGEVWGDTPPIVACSVNLGIDTGESAGEHQNFNDVDDFIEPDFVSAVSYGNVLGDDFPSQVKNYFVKINVTAYSSVLKEITVTIKTPTDEEIVFSVLKGNY